MTAITTAANRQSRGSSKQTKYYMCATGVTIPKGAIVSVIAASGLADNAVSGTVNPVVGVAAETITVATALQKIEVEFDCEFLFTASSITQAMVGEPMLVVDNNTVDETSATSPVVGILTEFVSTTSGWVYVPGDSGAKAVL